MRRAAAALPLAPAALLLLQSAPAWAALASVTVTTCDTSKSPASVGHTVHATVNGDPPGGSESSSVWLRRASVYSFDAIYDGGPVDTLKLVYLKNSGLSSWGTWHICKVGVTDDTGQRWNWSDAAGLWFDAAPECGLNYTWTWAPGQYPAAPTVAPTPSDKCHQDSVAAPPTAPPAVMAVSVELITCPQWESGSARGYVLWISLNGGPQVQQNMERWAFPASSYQVNITAPEAPVRSLRLTVQKTGTTSWFNGWQLCKLRITGSPFGNWYWSTSGGAGVWFDDEPYCYKEHEWVWASLLDMDPSISPKPDGRCSSTGTPTVAPTGAPQKAVQVVVMERYGGPVDPCRDNGAPCLVQCGDQDENACTDSVVCPTTAPCLIMCTNNQACRDIDEFRNCPSPPHLCAVVCQTKKSCPKEAFPAGTECYASQASWCPSGYSGGADQAPDLSNHEPPTGAPVTETAAPTAAPTTAPQVPLTRPPGREAVPTAAPGGAACDDDRHGHTCGSCQAAQSCREAGKCITLPGGGQYCQVGAAFPDGRACGDGGQCSDGTCVTPPAGCALDGDCARAHDSQCVVYACRDGECRLLPADEGQECDDGDPATARDSCAAGKCVGIDLCQGVQCPPGQCTLPGSCRPADGRCAWLPRNDGDPCAGPDHAVVVSECTRGECLTFAAMRISEMHIRSNDGPRMDPVAVFAPGTPAAGPRAACAAADRSRGTDYTDTRVALVRPRDYGAVGDGQLDLSRLSGGSYGGVVYAYPEARRPSEVRVVDSPRNTHQAPVQLRLSACMLSRAAADNLTQLGALCGGPAQGDAALLQRWGAALSGVRWVSLPLGAPAPVQGDAAQRAFPVRDTAEKYRCFLVAPVALRSGCSGNCGVLWADSASGIATLAVVAAVSTALGVIIGCRFGRPTNTEPPPLTGATADDVLRQCRDACAALTAAWRRSQHGLMDELASRMVVPPDGPPAAERLQLLLRQPWRDTVAANPQLSQLPVAALLALRLYSEEPQDTDRDMGWADAPPPGPTSAGHGLERGSKDPHLWETYKSEHAATGGARNPSPYGVPNRACCLLCADPRPSSLDSCSAWVRSTVAITWAAASCRPAAAGSGELRLYRMIGGLPRVARAGYGKLRPGQVFALPCLSSASASPEADGEFMGSDPAHAVLLHLRFTPETAVGVDMRDISMYPEEQEVLLPIFTVFEVTGMRKARILRGTVALEEPRGWAARAGRLLLHLRAAVRPLLVIEASCVGALDRLDPETAAWFAEVAKDAGALAGAGVPDQPVHPLVSSLQQQQGKGEPGRAPSLLAESFTKLLTTGSKRGSLCTPLLSTREMEAQEPPPSGPALAVSDDAVQHGSASTPSPRAHSAPSPLVPPRRRNAGPSLGPNAQGAGGAAASSGAVPARHGTTVSVSTDSPAC